MLSFRIFRNDSDTLATDFDLGDIEFKFGDETVSSRGSSRLSNMVYISVSDLIDGLLRINNGLKKYEFVGADSSFIVNFERTKKGVYVRYQRKSYGPFALRDILIAINSGIEAFVSDDLNQLPQNTAASIGFNGSWSDLKAALFR